MAMLASGVAGPGGAEERGLHSYFVPKRRPDRDYVLFSSCTAMPLLEWGYEICDAPYRYVIEAEDRGELSYRLGVVETGFERKLLAAMSAPEGTKVVVAASPADAFRMAATLFVLESNGPPVRTLFPSVLEMASDVPMALQGRSVVPGPGYGESLLPGEMEVIQIPLRNGQGELLNEMTVADHFETRSAAAKGRTVAYMTFGDATGAAGPIAHDCYMMDATQMRLRGSRIGDHLKRRFAMVICGSTFLGGPAHSGALLLPPGSVRDEVWRQACELWAGERSLTWKSHEGFSRGFANMLRWMPGLYALERLAELGAKADTHIARMTAEMTDFLREFPAFEVFEGRSAHQAAICGRDSGIVSFAVRKGRHWMTMPDLIALYRKLAEEGVLLGHPIVVGNRAALRLSIAAGDVDAGSIERKLARLADVLSEAGFSRRANVGHSNTRSRQAASRPLSPAVCWQ